MIWFEVVRGHGQNCGGDVFDAPYNVGKGLQVAAVNADVNSSWEMIFSSNST